MKTRLATAEDISSIHQLYIDYLEERLELKPEFDRDTPMVTNFLIEAIGKPLSDILVTLERTDVIGFALVRECTTPNPSFKASKKFAFLEELVVAREMRGNGVGTLLLEEVRVWTRARELPYIELKVNNDNIPAFRLCKDEGFVSVSQNMRAPIR